MRLSAKLPQDDEGAKLIRFESIRGQRYTEIFLIGGHAITHHLVAGVYNTIGMNDPAGTGDTCPQDVLDQVDVEDLAQKYGVLGAFKNGPRLWCLDWVEAMVGAERDFSGLTARWVKWLDVPKEMRKHESVAYKPVTGKRDTQLGISKGSPAFLLDDPDGDSWCMKSASLIVDPGQTYQSLKDLGGRLTPPPGWTFRAVILDQDLVLTPDDGAARITQDHPGRPGQHLRPDRRRIQQLQAVKGVQLRFTNIDGHGARTRRIRCARDTGSAASPSAVITFHSPGLFIRSVSDMRGALAA